MGRQNSKQFELLMSDLGKQDLVAVGSIDTNDRIVFFVHISCCVAAMYISRVSVGVVASCSCCVKLQAEKLRLEEERMRKLQAEKLRLEETMRPSGINLSLTHTKIHKLPRATYLRCKSYMCSAFSEHKYSLRSYMLGRVTIQVA